jgi:hypothetical protein
MPFYPDSEVLYAVVNDLFGRVVNAPEVLHELSKDKMTLRINIVQPDAVIMLDTRTQPPSYVLRGSPQSRADIGLHVEADVLHGVWLSQIRLRDAYTAGKLRIEGNPLFKLPQLMRLAPVFRFLESEYAPVLRERGLL